MINMMSYRQHLPKIIFTRSDTKRLREQAAYGGDYMKQRLLIVDDEAGIVDMMASYFSAQ